MVYDVRDSKIGISGRKLQVLVPRFLSVFIRPSSPTRFASGLILGPRIVFTLDSSHWAKGYIDADSRSDNTQNKEDADVDGNSATSMDEDGADSAEDGTDSTEDATTVDEDNVGADERQARIMDEDSVDVQD